MWPWMKHWRGWLMSRIVAPLRLQSLSVRYSRASLVVTSQAIPWNAEAVQIEANLRLSPAASRRRSDFLLVLPDREAVEASLVRSRDGWYPVEIRFDLPAPSGSIQADLLYRGHSFARIALPVLSSSEYLNQLQLRLPSAAVQLGQEVVPCRCFVASQARGLLLSALLYHPAGLFPLHGLHLHVQLQGPDGASRQLPIHLSAEQLAGESALVTVAVSRLPRCQGEWSVQWRLGERVLGRLTLRGLSQQAFQQSLRIRDRKFVVESAGGLSLCEQPPTDSRAGPYFLLASAEPEAVGMVRLRLRPLVLDDTTRATGLEQRVLIGPAPTPFTLGTLDAEELTRLGGFEVLAGRCVLGQLSLQPPPVAHFTSEGCYLPLPDYEWSAAAEREIARRLGQLLEEPEISS